jgi:hypothetical protein
MFSARRLPPGGFAFDEDVMYIEGKFSDKGMSGGALCAPPGAVITQRGLPIGAPDMPCRHRWSGLAENEWLHAQVLDIRKCCFNMLVPQVVILLTIEVCFHIFSEGTCHGKGNVEEQCMILRMAYELNSLLQL